MSIWSKITSMRDIIKEPVKTVFLGSGWESLETLKALDEDNRFEIVAVVTPVDALVGRKQISTPSEVKKYALEKKIAVVHTEKQKEKYIKLAEEYKPELVVCKAFGEIVPKEFLEYPKYSCINIHFSLLPKYRGAVPIQKAILDGEKETGISIILMSEGLDEGDILKIYEEDILPTDTNLSLRERLVKKSSEVLGDILEEWILGEITPIEQNNEDATYCWQKDISKENAQINWTSMTPEYIERMVRAFIPWPIVWTVVHNDLKNITGKTVKIFKAELVECSSENNPGDLFVKDGMVLFVTKDPLTCLRVFELQIEGKNKMSEKEFVNGLRT